MCVWTGYIGPRPASEEALAMLEKIEGIWAGFFTGVASRGADNRLHHAKTVGATAQWRKQFDTAALPGTAALAHSRTNSGGGSEWSHPFTSSDGRVVLIGQGSPGLFADDRKAASAACNRLVATGCTFASAVPRVLGRYPMLHNGLEVAASDFSAGAIAYLWHCLGCYYKAARTYLTSFPSEAVLAFMTVDTPATIWVANANQRCVAGFAPGELFLSTTTLAFPKRVERIKELPANSVSAVTVNGVVTERLGVPFDAIAEPPADLEEAVVAWLDENPERSLAQIVDNAINPNYPADGLRRSATAGYRILEQLYREGRLVPHHIAWPNIDKTLPEGLLTRWSLAK